MGKEEVNFEMQKIAVLLVGFCMLCFSMTGIAATFTTIPWSPNEEIVSDEILEINQEYIGETVEDIIPRLLELNQEDFTPIKENQQSASPQPLLGEGEVFGLWIHIIYKDRYGNLIYDGIEQVNINRITIRGKLSDPGYRTPIKFDADGDGQDDVETGFGFFRSGIDEIKPDGSTENHPAWATAFDFRQINDWLDDQLGELEIWQEFHVNLDLITNAAGFSQSSPSSPILRGTQQTLLEQTLLEGMPAPLGAPVGENTIQDPEQGFTGEPIYEPEPLPASEDYFVTRVGYRSPVGEKIPIRFEKKFVVAKDNIFRPFIFQKEMDPNDIIGTASNDVMFGFQSYQAGYSDPAYDIEFSVNFDPAVYTVTQFIPREGKIVYYYHDCGVGDPLDITFSAKVNIGGTSNEEEEGTLSLTLTLDTPNEVAGTGKWMLFDPEIIGDWDILGGKFIYASSHNFDVGFTVTSPRFEQKIEVKGIPKQATISWDADVVIESGDFVTLGFDAYVDLSMSSNLDKVIVYYPRTDPNDPELTAVEISAIPSCRMGAGAELKVDPDDFTNPGNYISGNVYRTASSDLQYIKLFLPDPEVTIPIIKVTDIPANVNADAQLYWNKLQGHAYANRAQAGAQDPVYLHLDFGQFTINNKLEILDGHIRTDFHINEDGYFGFDCTEKMFTNIFNIANNENDNELGFSLAEISVDDFWADWELDTSGEQLQIESLGLSGFIDTLTGFEISLTLNTKNVEFDADWTTGESGSLEFDFYQDDNIYLDFDLSQGDVVFYGDVELSNDLHWDISWKWQAGSYLDPAYFRINHNTNQPNIEEINLYFTYKDTWGADITLSNGGIYICLEWYWNNWLYTWPVINVYGTLDFWVILDSLTNYQWIEIV